MIIIPIKWLFHWEYTLFSDKPIYREGTDTWQKNDGDIGRPWNGRDTEVGGLNST